MKQTFAAPEFAHYPQDWHFSPVLLSGDFAFLSGQTDVAGLTSGLQQITDKVANDPAVQKEKVTS